MWPQTVRKLMVSSPPPSSSLLFTMLNQIEHINIKRMKHWYEHEQEFYTLLYIYGGCVHMCCIKIERLIINNNNNFDDDWYCSSFDSKMTNDNHTKLVRRKLKLKCIYLYWFLCNVLGHSLVLCGCVCVCVCMKCTFPVSLLIDIRRFLFCFVDILLLLMVVVVVANVLFFLMKSSIHCLISCAQKRSGKKTTKYKKIIWMKKKQWTHTHTHKSKSGYQF